MVIRFPGAETAENAENRGAPGPSGHSDGGGGEYAPEASAGELAHRHRVAELGLLSAGLAHQLRHTMTALVGLSEVLLQALPEEEAGEARREALLLRRESLRGMRLVRLLLEYLQSPAGLRRDPVLVDEVMEDAVSLWRLQRLSSNIRVERTSGQAGLRVAGPGLLLEQVLLNLMINATQAMVECGGNGIIRLAVWRRDRRVVIEVADDGPGIPPERQSRLFEPLAGVAAGHTGLGLYLCEWMVRQLGGSITLRQSEPGQTVFQIELPVEDAAGDHVLPPPRARLRPAPPPARLALSRLPLRVLVIEDEPAVVEFLRAAFRRRGDRVSAVSSLAQARRVLARADWQLILLDWRIGTECASTLLGWLDRQRPDLTGRVLLLSGEVSADLRAAARGRGLLWLEKPFTLDELWQAVGKFFVVTEENSSRAA